MLRNLFPHGLSKAFAASHARLLLNCLQALGLVRIGNVDQSTWPYLNAPLSVGHTCLLSCGTVFMSGGLHADHISQSVSLRVGGVDYHRDCGTTLGNIFQLLLPLCLGSHQDLCIDRCHRSLLIDGR